MPATYFIDDLMRNLAHGYYREFKTQSNVAAAWFTAMPLIERRSGPPASEKRAS